ncbi:hypothetical protein AALP_AA7G117300 [Arabis alpina]|uniref:Uncharacterized protein n=1 Tax=Arabis alpina TaxID=50452 RepID=A0A087GHG2_ARAAL|nr:hypothetical protein AALP_AA7G117300 [Arabis alpina]
MRFSHCTLLRKRHTKSLQKLEKVRKQKEKLKDKLADLKYYEQDIIDDIKHLKSPSIEWKDHHFEDIAPMPPILDVVTHRDLYIVIEVGLSPIMHYL